MATMKVIIKLLLGFSLVLIMVTTKGATAADECYVEKVLVMHECMGTIRQHHPYVPPTEKCHATVRKSDMNCICRIFTQYDESTVNPKKRLARECGSPVRVGYTCGSCKYFIFINS